MLRLTEKIKELHASRKLYSLVTLIDVRGSAPQVTGAKMLVTSEGLYWGTVGGGKIEAHAIRYAQDLLVNEKSSHSMTWNLQSDIGMSCGGEVTLFFDVQHGFNWNLAIFGAGHVSQELCRLMTTWSCQVFAFDTRSEWLERLPSAAHIEKKLSVDMAEDVSTLPAGTYIICLSQGHATDVPVLASAFKRAADFPFIGVIGSDVKAKKIKSELVELGAAPELVQKLICPLGLPIGNNTPAEIAISIAAQLLAVRDQKNFKVTIA